VRAAIAIMLTLVAASSMHVTRLLACDGAVARCGCCTGHEGDEHADHAQRIAPICGCSVESAPEHLPPLLNGPVTSASASVRMAGAPMVACVTLRRPAGVERQLAIDAHPVPRPPCPSCSLLAQNTSMVV
jgi:hypothetical protein